LDELIEERTKENPGFKAMFEETVKKRQSLHNIRKISTGMYDRYGMVVREGDVILVTYSYENPFATSPKDMYQQTSYEGTVLYTSSGNFLTEDIHTHIYRPFPSRDHTIKIQYNIWEDQNV